MKKILLPIALLLCITLMGTLTGCNTAKDTDKGNDAENKAEVPSVALLLNGPISDMGWNASAYNALTSIEKKYGAKISYSESVPQSDMEDVFRSYAETGYNVIYGHGSQFTDACLAVAKDYPEVQFVIINGNKTSDNVACVQIADDQQGFLMGAFAGLMTKTGTVGILGGLNVPPIANAVKGFAAGAKYVNKDVKVLSTLTGTSDDAAKAKETTLAYIDQGADYVGAVAGAAGLGSIEACQDKGIYAIGGAGGDQNEAAPETVVVSVIKDISVPFFYAYEKMLDNTLEEKIYRVGVKEKAVYYSPYHGFEDTITQEVKDQLAKIVEDLANDKIDIGNISY